MTLGNTPSAVPDVLEPGARLVLKSIPLYLPSCTSAEYGQGYDSMYIVRGWTTPCASIRATTSAGGAASIDHLSGYNCITGAFFHTAAAFFGKKPIAFDLVRKVAGEADQTRSYRQFTDVIDDTIDARVYIGIHFRAPDVQGAEIGKDVARWLDQHFFGPAK